jgi:hypothetical protein
VNLLPTETGILVIELSLADQEATKSWMTAYSEVIHLAANAKPLNEPYRIQASDDSRLLGAVREIESRLLRSRGFRL